MWTFREGIKTIQIEEFLPLEQNGYLPEQIVNRYLHARWDPTFSEFIHMDGAIRVYDASDYPARLANDLKKYEGKASQYNNAFRLDGKSI